MPRRVAYLTIDDGPSTLMPQKMEHLSRRGAPAIWFCQGNYLEKRPDCALEAIERGFLLGNHSYDHPHFSRIGLSECFDQIRRTHDILERLHSRSGVTWEPRYFRFPFGDKGERNKTELQGFLKQMGYQPPPSRGIAYAYYRDQGLDADVDWYWTYDVMDWSINSPEPQRGIDSVEKVLARMDEDDPENGKGLNSGHSVEIILVHDHEDTSAHFERIINHLLAKRFSFSLPATTERME